MKLDPQGEGNIDALTMEEYLMTMGHKWKKEKAQELVATSKKGELFNHM